MPWQNSFEGLIYVGSPVARQSRLSDLSQIEKNFLKD
jgi:hypothetical protein